MATKSSRRWLKEHFSDSYVKQAQQSGYRSRAAYKLLEINKIEHLLKSGMVVIDLGAAPGGWSQVAADIVRSGGQVVAVDLLPMVPLKGVDFLQGDFSEETVVSKIISKLTHRASSA